MRIITTDARLFEGILQGFDKSTNIVVSDCIERVIAEPDDEEGNQELELGLYMMRGGNIVCIGEIDESVDSLVDWSKIRGDVLKDTKNPL